MKDELEKIKEQVSNHFLKDVHHCFNARKKLSSSPQVSFLTRGSYAGCFKFEKSVLFAALKNTGVPVIHFTTRTSAFLEDIAADGSDLLGVDAQLPIAEVRNRLGWDKPVQGNLEPLALLAPWRELKYRIDEVLDGNGGKPGHIFNVGHGLVPATDPDAVARLVDYVHERTSGVGR